MSEPVLSEPTAPVLRAVVRLLAICSAGMDADDLSAVAVQAALDEFVAIAADQPRSVLAAAAVRTAELFMVAANAPLSSGSSGTSRPAGRSASWASEPAEPWELASATGGLRVLLAALSAASTVDLIDSCLEQE